MDIDGPDPPDDAPAHGEQIGGASTSDLPDRDGPDRDGRAAKSYVGRARVGEPTRTWYVGRAQVGQPRRRVGFLRGNAAEADETHELKLTHLATGEGQVPPARPPDPIGPFVRQFGPRRRRREWPIVIVVFLIAGLVLAGCCLAGFVVYTNYVAPR